MSIATKTAYTPEDLLTMPDGNRYELIEGKLVGTPKNVLPVLVANEISRLLSNFCVEHEAGWIMGVGTTYQCFPHAPGRVRKPEVSLIRKERLSAGLVYEEGHVTISPDLAIEVLSPHDTAYEVDQKIQDYLHAKVPLIWKVNPELRTVTVFRADGTMTYLTENDEITGEAVLPGFRCIVCDFFRLPEA